MTLFFIHGSGCTGAAFDAQVAAFPGAVATTLPGHGPNAAAGSPDTIEAFARAVELELASRTGVVLCGSSMGGAVALEVALGGHPAVAGVIAIGSGARLRVPASLFEEMDHDFEGAARRLASSAFYARPTPELVDATVAMMLSVGRTQTIRDFRACNAFDVSERLGSLKVPMLAITGAADVMTPPKYAQFFADRVPGATARILPDAGHLAMVEHPHETNAEIRAFVEQMGTR